MISKNIFKFVKAKLVDICGFPKNLNSKYIHSPDFFKDVSFHVSFHVKFGYMGCCDFSINNTLKHMFGYVTVLNSYASYFSFGLGIHSQQDVVYISTRLMLLSRLKLK